MRKTNRLILMLLGILILTGLAWFVLANQRPLPKAETKNTSSKTSTQQVTPPPSFTQTTFDLIKTPHFVSSEPANNSLLTTQVTSIVIKFNFDVVPPSKITVTRDGESVTSGTPSFSADSLTMTTGVDARKTGNYKVDLYACWPDKSCHNGSFGFSVKLP